MSNQSKNREYEKAMTLDSKSLNLGVWNDMKNLAFREGIVPKYDMETGSMDTSRMSMMERLSNSLRIKSSNDIIFSEISESAVGNIIDKNLESSFKNSTPEEKAEMKESVQGYMNTHKNNPESGWGGVSLFKKSYAIVTGVILAGIGATTAMIPTLNENRQDNLMDGTDKPEFMSDYLKNGYDSLSNSVSDLSSSLGAGDPDSLYSVISGVAKDAADAVGSGANNMIDLAKSVDLSSISLESITTTASTLAASASDTVATMAGSVDPNTILVAASALAIGAMASNFIHDNKKEQSISDFGTDDSDQVQKSSYVGNDIIRECYGAKDENNDHEISMSSR